MQQTTSAARKKAAKEIAVLIARLSSDWKTSVAEYRDTLRRVLIHESVELRLSVREAMQLVGNHGTRCFGSIGCAEALCRLLNGVEEDLSDPRVALLLETCPKLRVAIINRALRRSSPERVNLLFLRKWTQPTRTSAPSRAHRRYTELILLAQAHENDVVLHT